MKSFTAGMIVAAIASGASAQVGGFIGNVELDAAPASLEMQAYESNSQISLISERMGHVLTEDMLVDATGVGFYDSTNLLAQTLIPAGTKVDSWILHADAVGILTTWDESVVLAGGVTFDREILGVMVLDATMDASDAEVGALGTIYTVGSNRGLELDLFCPILKYDSFTISADQRSFSVLTHTDRKADQVRIITKALGPVPTPGAAGLLGAAGLVALRRRR